MMDRLIQYVEAEIQQLQSDMNDELEIAAEVCESKGKDVHFFMELVKSEVSEAAAELQIKMQILNVLKNAAQKNLSYAN